jgi:glycosyltransferase involved in cell wall biosynthesis
MKLIIQIPCYNEEKNLLATLKDLPKEIPGVDKIEILIIDDGSTDNTVKVAREYGVHHIVQLTKNKGLAAAFMAGLEASLSAGADIIVNTDGDNQYKGKYIAELVKPILEGKAEIVIGKRPISSIEHFSPLKKKLQRFGSWIVQKISKTDIPDAPSGFRAFSRDAAMRINVLNEYTYTLETIIQAGRSNMAITHIPIEVNENVRQSRLMKSIWHYIFKSVSGILRTYLLYKPLKIFTTIGLILLGIGFLFGLRFLYFLFIVGDGRGHIQSLILTAILLIIGFNILILGLVTDLIASNRKFLENIIYKLRKIEYSKKENNNKDDSSK